MRGRRCISGAGLGGLSRSGAVASRNARRYNSSVRVRVLFFGQLREIVGAAEEAVELDDGSSVEQLFARYGSRHPALAGFRPSVVASVNQEFARWDAPLASGDEVAFLPPVSGGSGDVALAEDVFELVRSPIAAAELVALAKSPSCGAVATFDGIVRDHSGTRRTLYLEYEAYEPMALAKMREIGAEIRRRFRIHRLVMVHRLGRMEIGETSVFIVTSAAHRAPALDACRFAIDTLKRLVPIWKKEYFADGSAWAEGARPVPLAAGPAGEPETLSRPGESTE
jgi:molybdopterin converting factor subunit 1